MSLKISKCPFLVSFLYTNCYLFVLVKSKLYFYRLPSFSNFIYFAEQLLHINKSFNYSSKRRSFGNYQKLSLFPFIYRPFLLYSKAYPIIHTNIGEENLQNFIFILSCISLILRKLFMHVEVHASRKIAFTVLQRGPLSIQPNRRRKGETQ